MRRPVAAGNWKMYKDALEAMRVAREIRDGVAGIDNVDLVIAPTALAIPVVSVNFVGTNLAVSAQNCHWEKEGAFTGEISAAMFKDAGCDYVIIGHSERRQIFKETDDIVSQKVKAAIKAGLIPIICVGETLEEREVGWTMDVVNRQVTAALREIEDELVAGIIIAYEPVWAIGAKAAATPSQAQEVHGLIRRLLGSQYSEKSALAVRLLYGGSVKPDNIEDLMKEEDIDGCLIGGASLNAESFIDMAKKTSLLYAAK